MIRFALASASWGIRAAPARSATTLIAVASAACCVLFCAAIIGGFDETLTRLNFGAAANAVTVRPNPITNARSGPPTSDDLLALKAALPGGTSAAAWVQGSAAFQGTEGTATVPVYGASGDYRRELATELVDGRWPTADEMAGNARICLLGEEVAGQLGPGAQTGGVLHLSGMSCEIVGMLAYPSVRPARRFAGAVVMPIGMVRRYFADAETERRDLAWFTLFFASGEQVQAARQIVDGTLRKIHGVPQSRLSPFTFDDPDAQIKDQERQRLMMARLLGSVTSITLLVSIISYAAVMIASCRARAREFAIRMAMGALRRDIVRQIVFENLLLSLGGSLIGLFAGSALACFANARWGWPTATNGRLMLLTSGGSLAIGCMIGAWGGLVAGRTPPAVAAR